MVLLEVIILALVYTGGIYLVARPLRYWQVQRIKSHPMFKLGKGITYLLASLYYLLTAAAITIGTAVSLTTVLTWMTNAAGFLIEHGIIPLQPDEDFLSASQFFASAVLAVVVSVLLAVVIDYLSKASYFATRIEFLRIKVIKGCLNVTF